MRLLISGSWVRAPRWAISFWLPFLRMDRMLYTRSFTHVVSTAPWLSWLKRLSSKQEIPSSNLGGASFWGIQRIFLGERNIGKKQKCRDPGSNRGPLDLQSNALPTELSRQQIISDKIYRLIKHKDCNSNIQIIKSIFTVCFQDRGLRTVSGSIFHSFCFDVLLSFIIF